MRNMTSNNNNNNNNKCIQEQQREEKQQQQDNPYDYEVKITVIVGPPADKMINALKRGEGFSYRDKSVEGVPILEVWAEVDKGFWWD